MLVVLWVQVTPFPRNTGESFPKEGPAPFIHKYALHIPLTSINPYRTNSRSGKPDQLSTQCRSVDENVSNSLAGITIILV